MSWTLQWKDINPKIQAELHEIFLYLLYHLQVYISFTKEDDRQVFGWMIWSLENLKIHIYNNLELRVLYMSSDKFLLAVESRDLSQADKSIIIVYSFPKLSDG